MTTASGARNALPAVFAITFAKATALSSAAPLVYWLIPARPKMPTSSLVPAPRRSRLHDLRHRDRALRLYAGLSDTSGTASCCSFRHVSDLARGRLGRREQVG